MPVTDIKTKWVNGALVVTSSAGTTLATIADTGITFATGVEFDGNVTLDAGSIFGDGVVRSAVVTATLAEVNAGKTLIAGVTGKTIKVLDYTMLFDGAFQTATSVDLQDTNGTPVVIANLAVAGATDGAVVKPDHTNITNGAGYLANLTAGAGVAVGKTGSDATNGTSVKVCVLYSIE